jgi:chromosomal replication initiation ATPase DnaA
MRQKTGRIKMPEAGMSEQGPVINILAMVPPSPRALRAERRQIREIQRAAQVALTQETIAGAFKISVIEMRARTRRTARVALARQIAMYLMHVAFGLSLSAVGHYFGRDRTTAAHACRQIEDRRDDPDFDCLIDRLEFAVRSMPQEQFRQ